MKQLAAPFFRLITLASTLAGTLLPALAETATVRVLGPDSKPMPGAELVYEYMDEGSRGRKSYLTDAEGRATIDVHTWSMDNERWRGTVAAGVPGFAIATANFGTAPQIDTAPVIQLTPEQTREGKVVDEAGAPVAGAQVWITRIAPNNADSVSLHNVPIDLEDSPLASHFHAVTDAGGRYILKCLPAAGWLQLQLDDKRFAEDRVWTDSGRPQMPSLTARPGAALRGRILQNGVPAAGIRVCARPGEGVRGWGSGATTDSDGRYSVTGLKPGTYFVMTNAPAERELVSTAARATVVIGQTTAVPDIALQKGVVLEGIVRDDANGAGLHAVVLSYGLSRPREAGLPVTAVTDDRGHFRVRVMPGMNDLSVSYAPGYTNGERLTPRVRTGTNELVDFQLEHTVPLEGTARDAAGNLLPGVEIQIKRGDGGYWHRAVTDAGGHFKMDDLPPGELWLWAAGRWQVAVPLRVVLPLKSLNVTVEKRPAAPLRGRVVDSSGAPVAGADVTVTCVKNQQFDLTERLKTDADGRYATAMPVGGTTTVVVAMPGWKVRQQPVLTSRGEIVGLNGAPRVNPNATFEVADAVLEKAAGIRSAAAAN